MIFGELLADIPARDNPGLTVAKNCVPGPASYRPFSSAVPFSSALNSAARAAIAVKDSTGNAYNYAMSGTKLYGLVGTTMTDYTRAVGGDYAVETDQMAEFAEWGDKVIAVYGLSNGTTNVPQIITKSASNFANLGGIPPEARHIGVVRNFVVLGGIHDGTSRPNRIRWSAIENEAGWTAGTDQSDYQDLQSGGNIMRVVGGEYGTIFCETAIYRMTYVGHPLIFQFDETESGRGTISSGSVVNYGETSFYIGRDGFYMHSGGKSTPIGVGKVNKTFFSDLDQNYLWKITSAIDPINTLVFWSYPGEGNNGGLCNKIMVYNWSSNRWGGPIATQSELIYQAISAGVTLDGLSTAGYTDLDNLPYSLDSRSWQGGSVVLSSFTDKHKLASFTGSALIANIETGEFALSPGRSLVVAVKPLYDGTSSYVVMQVGTRNTGSDGVTWSTISGQHPRTGLCDFRANAYYHRFRILIVGGFDHVYGFEPVSEQAGAA